MHSGFGNFPRCFALPPLGEQGDKASHGGENLLLSVLFFLALVCFMSFFPLSTIAFSLFAFLYTECTFTQYAMFCHADRFTSIAGNCVRYLMCNCVPLCYSFNQHNSIISRLQLKCCVLSRPEQQCVIVQT